MSSDQAQTKNGDDGLKFAYWVPNVSGGLVVSKIEQRTDWGYEYNKKLAVLAENSGFEYALSQVRYMASYGAEFQHESTSFSLALLLATERLKVIAAIHPGLWHPGVLAKLTTPEQAAEVFKQAKPKFAVFSHIVTKEMQGKKGEDQIIARTRAAGYDGPLVMGVDRMRFEISDSVKTIEPEPLDRLRDGGRDLVLVADVADHRQRVAARRLDLLGRGEHGPFQLGVRLGRLGDQRHVGAVPRRPQRDLQADAPAATRDEQGFTRQRHRRLPSWRLPEGSTAARSVR